MQIHCAFCGKPFERESLPQSGEIECPHCNRAFDMANRETLGYGDVKEGESDSMVGKRLGGYRIVGEIGRGGMGVVYEGVQESLDRKVAIKVLFEESCKDPHFVARFEREAESLAKLGHPNIINILDRGCEEGVYFFVMEYVEGVSLRELMNEGPLNPTEAMAIIPVLCSALEYAHDEGVIHRDIKPENILIDRQGRVKVADFGLSRIVRGDGKKTRITHSNMVMGTPDYMAPEQRQDSKGVDHRADIFSLGVIFYEMLTGELPMGRFPPPSHKNIQIDVRLDEIVLKVLDKDPECRYQKASDIATDIKDLSGEEHEARDQGPPSPGVFPFGPEKDKAKSRTFVEVLEDGWETWVLVVAIILTLVNFLPNVLVLVAWFVLYKRMRSGRLARKKAEFSEDLAQGGEKGASPSSEKLIDFEEARKKLGIAWNDLKAMVTSGKLKAVKKGREWFFHPKDVEKAKSEMPPSPPTPPQPPQAMPPQALPPKNRTSILAVIAAMYGIGILLVIPILLPFQGELNRLYAELSPEQMAATLSIGVLAALPGLLGLLIAVVARTRVAVHDHLGGAFPAVMGLLGSVVFLGVGAHFWIQAHETYSYWVDMRKKVATGEEEAMKKLRTHAMDPATRGQALRIAATLDTPRARQFYEWAATNEGDLKMRALQSWAKNFASDPESRTALQVHIDRFISLQGEEGRMQALDLLESLPGSDNRSYLLEASSDPSPRVRRAVARCLAIWKDGALVDTATTLAVDLNREVARDGFEALEGLSDHLPIVQTVDAYALVLRKTPHPVVRQDVISRIRRASKKHPLTEEAIRALEASAKGHDRETAQRARQALREIWGGEGDGAGKVKKRPTTMKKEKAKTAGADRQLEGDD